uniref:Meiotic nuclear division protein 1 homolog n=1 Tax=Plectus sambesii TaxID=2011161 RepID=A0A914XEW6_9BILA
MASKKKGLSLEEKRQRLLDLLFEKKEFFQLKDLERIAPKEKGIVAQSVKDVTQMLVDDGLVDAEKIGTFMCYWAFPSKALQSRKRRLDEVSDQLKDVRVRMERAKGEMTEAAKGKEESAEREELLKKVLSLETRKTELLTELEKHSEFDPVVVEKMRKEAEIAKTAANRWTDNIFATKSWCKSKFHVEEMTLNRQFGIPAELDYID